MGGVIRRLVVSASIAIAAACSSPAQQGAPSPSASATAPSWVSAPFPPLTPGSRTAIRDNTARSAFVSGVGLEARALVSKVTPDDGLRLAIRFVHEAKPAGPDPWDAATLDGSAVLTSVRFEMELPGGTKRTLEVAPDRAAAPWPISPAAWVPTLTLRKGGLDHPRGRRAWKTPADDVFSTKGTIAVIVSATFRTNGDPIALVTSQLAFEVVEPSDMFKPMVDLERAASEVAQSTWKSTSLPIPLYPTVDDVDGNLSVRLSRADGSDGFTGHTDEELEVWLDRAGKVLAVDAYKHDFRPAEGTRGSEPSGDVPLGGFDRPWGPLFFRHAAK